VRELVVPPGPRRGLQGRRPAAASARTDKGAVVFLGYGDMGAEAAQQASAVVAWGLRDMLDFGAVSGR
jgi:hypothetical protein